MAKTTDMPKKETFFLSFLLHEIILPHKRFFVNIFSYYNLLFYIKPEILRCL
ncbi:hypothetical protein DW934_10000 [Blautia obeum]|uniref:Uncharacterized protein n=1 Tax=Blautia obeum TaxID=40520 RepID=A0A414J569_9FIRM|nr:hypothetical protein DW934_10000 [Blautia obeum]RHE39532.1 hypothetical protein DW740_09840 [Blautia obeum]